MDEFKLIDSLKRKIPRLLQGLIPIGDDTALLKVPKGKVLLFTTDAVVDGIDFQVSKTQPKMAGRKALAINLSDIAAMGGGPYACVVTLGIPEKFSEKWLRGFYSGLIKLAQQYRVMVTGGDISRAKEFFASVALIGVASKNQIVIRSGARPGDWIGVTGELGGSILGHHYGFMPRVREARFLASYYKPSAMMDISDGFWQDLEHLLLASKVGARIDLDKIPISKDALKCARQNPCKAIEHALTDGEDFELLFALRPGKKLALEKAWRKQFPKVRLSWVGRIQKGRRLEWFYHGQKQTMKKNVKKGYQHFS